MPGGSGAGRLLERGGILEAGALLVGRLRRGESGALFISGEAGMGKTSVLEEVLAEVPEGTLVGTGRGDAMEQWLPFGVVTSALDGVGAHPLSAATDAETPAAERRAALYHDIRRWLAERPAPVVIALDDLHWADPDSLALVAFLCRRATASPLAVIGALRPWPPAAADMCTALSGSGAAVKWALEPLTEGAAVTLLEGQLSAGLTAQETRRAWALTAGNPLLLEQVARAVGRGEVVPRTRNGEGAGAVGAQLVLGRFAGLPAEGFRFIQCASVLGCRFRTDAASDLSELAASAVDAVVETLCRGGLLRSAGGQWVEFTHPLFHQALYEDLPEPVRARLHGRAFHFLLRRGLETEAAEHAVRGDLAGDPHAVAVLERAGRDAMRSAAPATAAERLQAAVRVAGAGAPASLLVALGEALVACGSPEAVAVLERALLLELPVPARVGVLRMLGAALTMAADFTAASSRFTEAATLAEGYDPQLAAGVLLDHALNIWVDDGPAASLPLAARAREMARRTDEASQRRTLAAWGYVAFLGGDPSGVPAIEEEARRLLADPLARPAPSYGMFGAVARYGSVCTLSERFEEGERAFLDVLAAAARLGAPGSAAATGVNYAHLLYRQGRLAEGLAQLEKAMEVADVVPFILRLVPVGFGSFLLAMGRLEESDDWCRRIEATPWPVEALAHCYVLDVQGQRGFREGRPAEASDAFLRLERTMRRMGLNEPCVVPWARHAVLSHAAAGRVDDARRVIGWLDGLGARLRCRFPRIAAGAGRAALAERAGDHDAAEREWRGVFDLHAGVDLRLEHIETLLDHGAYLRRRGRLEAARRHLAEAVESAEAAGAGWFAGLAAQELRAAGGRRRTARYAPDALTPAEERVATLAAEGHANRAIAQRLFIAEATVESHLLRVFSKLGIRSRRQLMTQTFRDSPDAGRAGPSAHSDATDVPRRGRNG